jgi:hypothetical protein
MAWRRVSSAYPCGFGSGVCLRRHTLHR